MEIREIKARLPLLTVLTHYGLKPDKNGFILCPFHDDHNPSLKIYPRTNTFNCFGCGASGDQVQFIQLKEKSNKHEAILKATSFINPKYTTMPDISKPPKTDQEPQVFTRIAVLTKYLQSCKSSMERSKPAQEYCRKRNLNPNKLNIGFNGTRLLDSWNDKLKVSAAGTGLITKTANGYSQQFRNCITFELQNRQGQPVSIYGRHIEETSQRKHVYLPGKHEGLYPCYPNPMTERLILTESIIDAATLRQAQGGLRTGVLSGVEVLACYGTNGFTEEHREAIKELKNLKEIILFFDGDDPGTKAITRISEELRELRNNITISYIETPKDEDINSLSAGHEPELFTHLIETRKPLKQEINQESNSFPRLTDAVGQVLSEISENKEKPETRNTKPAFTEVTAGKPATRFDASHPEYIRYESGDIRITIWGKIDTRHINRLRATLHIRLKSNEYAEYRDTVDLYSNNQVTRLTREAASRLEVDSDTMTRTITELTKNLEQYRADQREIWRQKEKQEREKNLERFTDKEMNEGLKFLQSKSLMQKTFDCIKNIGLVGEEKNGMLLFFILLTRMFTSPLHALVQGKSGSGKTYLLKKIADLIPKQHIKITTALTENTLYHSLEDFWKHSILLIEDLDGAYNALLPLREMMTNQSICKYTTEKDIRTGEFKQKALYVEGPVCVAGATTKDKIYEDNANRSFQIHINESSEHIEKVLEYQRKYISGLTERKAEEHIQTLFKTAQMHLRLMEIIIPFGDELRIPDYVYKKLRSNMHYMTLIKAITFWNQQQREMKQLPDGTFYIESTLEDVRWANYLSKEVLLRKSDELSGALRGFFESIKARLKGNSQKCFYVKPIRENLRMNPMQVSRYLRELDARGYIQRTGGNRKKGFEYEVLVWDDYEKLKAGINVMDEILERLKAKYNISVTQV